MRILVAGIGNIFFGDDAFGVEVMRSLAARTLPEGVHVEDFGIRSYDLAYAIMDGYDAVILVDAVPRNAEPGTLFLIEPDMDDLAAQDSAVANAHTMTAASVLQMVKALGDEPGKMLLVGCEPAVLESDELGLSETVRAAVPHAVEMICTLVEDLRRESNETAKVVIENVPLQ